MGMYWKVMCIKKKVEIVLGKQVVCGGNACLWIGPENGYNLWLCSIVNEKQ